MTSKTWSRQRAHGLYAVVSILALAFMICHAEDAGFWYDEFAQLCYSGLGKTLAESIAVPDPTPPLFTAAANIWCRFAPFGERWLLLLPQLATAAAVYLAGLWGERLFSSGAGFLTAVLMGFSPMVIEQCGLEFRSYGFYLFFSALALCLRMLWLEKERAKVVLGLCYTFALAGLAYSHLFGALICAVLGGIDIFQALFRRKKALVLFPYILSGLLFLPWALYFLRTAGGDAVSNPAVWMTTPSLWETIKLVAYLCGNHIVVCLLLVIGSVRVLRDCLASVKYKKWEDTAFQRLIPFILCFFVISLLYLYGSLRDGYATLWVKRYFTGLFPCCAVLCAYGGNLICRGAASLVKNEQKKKKVRVGVYVALTMAVIPITVYQISTASTPFTRYYHREAAELLCEQPDIAQNDVLVLSTLGDYADGWETYYVKKLGARDGFQAFSAYAFPAEELSLYQVVYVEHGYPKIDDDIWKILNQNFVVERTWENVAVDRYVKQ